MDDVDDQPSIDLGEQVVRMRDAAAIPQRVDGIEDRGRAAKDSSQLLGMGSLSLQRWVSIQQDTVRTHDRRVGFDRDRRRVAHLAKISMERRV